MPWKLTVMVGNGNERERCGTEMNGKGDENADDKETNTTETFAKWLLVIRRMNGTMDHEMRLKFIPFGGNFNVLHSHFLGTAPHRISL